MILPGCAIGSAKVREASARRASCKIAEGREIAALAPQHGAEIARQRGIDGLKVDDLIALHDAEPRPGVRCKSDDFHGHVLLVSKGVLLDHMARSRKRTVKSSVIALCFPNRIKGFDPAKPVRAASVSSSGQRAGRPCWSAS
jgi:hypothetical protein